MECGTYKMELYKERRLGRPLRWILPDFLPLDVKTIMEKLYIILNKRKHNEYNNNNNNNKI